MADENEAAVVDRSPAEPATGSPAAQHKDSNTAPSEINEHVQPTDVATNPQPGGEAPVEELKQLNVEATEAATAAGKGDADTATAPTDAETKASNGKAATVSGPGKDSAAEHKDKDREVNKKERSKSRDDRDRGRDRDRDRERDRERDRDRDRDRDRRKRSRSRSRDKRRSSRRSSRSRSRSRDRYRRKSRSRSRDRRRRSRSRSRDRRRRSRSRSRDKRRVSPSRESDDELGGYQPRKRQGDGASTGVIKTDPKTDPFYYLRQQVPTDPKEAARLLMEQQLKARQLVLQQQAASAAQAASKTQRELYIGNLMPGLVTDVALRQLFNSAIVAQYPQYGLPGSEPVSNVNLHSDGRYAFIEFQNPELATIAVALNGHIQILGQTLSIGRPSGYVDPTKSAQAAAQATQALNQFQATGGSVAAPPMSLPAGLPPPPVLSFQEPGLSQAVTPFCCVTGMVTADVLQDHQEYMDVIEDLKEECSKYGQVVEVRVPRPPNPAAAAMYMGTHPFGKAYVQFFDNNGAAAAKQAISGRLFAGNTVNVQFIGAHAYAAIMQNAV